MNTHHYTAIVTNARQGLAVSTRNRPRNARRVDRGMVLIIAGLALFWVLVGVAVLA